MPREEALRVICYDISSDKSRSRVARLLEQKVSRVQFSVFEGRLTEASLRRLVASIEPHLAASDSLRVYTIGRTGERHCEVRGSGVPIEAEAGFWLM